MSKKILVLENKEGISELLNISLAYDYDVIMASNGEDALKTIRKTSPPLVIFDINVPDMDGIEFLCKVKKQSPQTEVITLADPENHDLGVTSLRYDASDYILKPVTSTSLEIALERAEKKLAVKKRLSPSSGNVFPSLIDTERSELAKQFIDILGSGIKGTASGLLSLHTRNAMILYTSSEHKKMFGSMEGKHSWEIFKRGIVKPQSCPVGLAFQTKKQHSCDIVVCLKDGKESKAHVVTAPLSNHSDQTDLVLEIITLCE